MPSHIRLDKLRRNRGYVLVLAFIVSAVVMPHDALPMATMAVSMYLLYEVGLLFARFFLKR
jgi:sec-independent protein translocase protein TatC